MIEIGDVICIPYTDNSNYIVGVIESYGKIGSLPIVNVRIQSHEGYHINIPMPNNRETEEWIIK